MLLWQYKVRANMTTCHPCTRPSATRKSLKSHLYHWLLPPHSPRSRSSSGWAGTAASSSSMAGRETWAAAGAEAGEDGEAGTEPSAE